MGSVRTGVVISAVETRRSGSVDSDRATRTEVADVAARAVIVAERCSKALVRDCVIGDM